MDEHPKTTFLDKLSAILSREPENRLQLLEVLRSAYERHLIDDDALFMIEGALQVSDIMVQEIMIPRSQIAMVDLHSSTDVILTEFVEHGHSRVPIYDGDRDHIVGILLAKDLLRLLADRNIGLTDLIRPVVFVPESKRLNVLLRDFRTNRNHMAIIVDEYGGVAGIVTIEDILEQIVGDIEDEYDYDDTTEDLILLYPDNRHRVVAKIALSEFDHAFSSHFSEGLTGETETLGDFLIQQFGYLPERGETIQISDLLFEVVRSDPRQLYTVMVEKQEADEEVS